MLQALAAETVTVDVRDLSADPPAHQARAVVSLLDDVTRRRPPGASVDVRGTGDDTGWQVSVLVIGGAAADAVVAPAGDDLQLRVVAVAPGLTRLVIRPETGGAS